MNSKPEFHRCSLPKINAGKQREHFEILKEEENKEHKIKADKGCLKKHKKGLKEKGKEVENAHDWNNDKPYEGDL